MSAPPLLVLAAGVIAAFLACLDAPFKAKIQQPALVFRTKEWWILWLVNTVVAAVVIYGAANARKVDLATFVGFTVAILGYPFLLKTRLVTVRGARPKDERSLGPQIVLDLAEAYLLPGMEDSISEQMSLLVGKYAQRSDPLESFERIAASAKNYLGGLRNVRDKEKREVLHYIDDLIDNAKSNPGNASQNGRAICYKVDSYGGLRGARWVLRNAGV